MKQAVTIVTKVPVNQLPLWLFEDHEYKVLVKSRKIAQVILRLINQKCTEVDGLGSTALIVEMGASSSTDQQQHAVIYAYHSDLRKGLFLRTIRTLAIDENVDCSFNETLKTRYESSLIASYESKGCVFGYIHSTQTRESAALLRDKFDAKLKASGIKKQYRANPIERILPGIQCRNRSSVFLPPEETLHSIPSPDTSIASESMLLQPAQKRTDELLPEGHRVVKEKTKRIIMASLRLHGITKTHTEFRSIYQHTLAGVMFALVRQPFFFFFFFFKKKKKYYFF